MGSPAQPGAWGQARATPIEIERARHLDEVLRDSVGGERIDDQTWHDLDMDRVFAEVDHACSIVGTQCLYARLRGSMGFEDLERTIELITPDASVRDQVRSALARLPSAGWTTPSMLWGTPNSPPVPRWLLRVLPVALVLALIGALLLHELLWFVFAAVFLATIVVHARTQREIGQAAASLTLASSLVSLSQRWLRTPAFGDLTHSLKAPAYALRKLPRRTWFIRFRDPLGVTEYVRLLLLSEARAYASCLHIVQAHRDDLRALYLFAGRIDAGLAVASLRSNSHTCRAVIDATLDAVSIRALRHPLVDDCHPNDIDAGPRSMLVTGVNMSGKSTLLRAVGIAAVMTRAFRTAFAEHCAMPPLAVMSTMRVHDDVSLAQSHYSAEVAAVADIVRRSVDAPRTWIVLVDELFRGTNSAERTAASAAVLEYLATSQLVLAATHDLELCALLGASFENVHLSGFVDERGIHLDHRLQAGVCPSSNAIPLLRHAGFPPVITERAEQLMQRD